MPLGGYEDQTFNLLNFVISYASGKRYPVNKGASRNGKILTPQFGSEDCMAGPVS